ncbi:DUF3618 domain-containing protein [Jannaschia sp. KMU-145]|uniref:DUF3618 domain-containing protein n=1 Tax=Jannaschia halovivens TaxID=3388667 RepID=UPI00396B1114
MSDDRSPAEIEREIEAERGALARSLEDLQRQFSPDHLIDTATGYAREHGGEFAQNVARQVKDNPIAAALAGIGVAWLMAGSGRKAPTYDRWAATHDNHAPYFSSERDAPAVAAPRPAWDDRSYGAAPGLRDDAPRMAGFDERVAYAAGDRNDPSAWDKISDTADDLGDAAARGWSDLKHSAADAWEKIEDLFDGDDDDDDDRAESDRDAWLTGAREGYAAARYRDAAVSAPSARGRGYKSSTELRSTFSEGTQSMSDKARERVLRARQTAYEAQRRIEERMGDYADEGRRVFDSQPLIGGLIAAGIGAAIGAALPRTHRENEMLGSYRDRAFDEADRVFREESAKLKAVAGAAVDEAKNVASDAIETAKGNTPTGQDAVDRAEDAATSAADRVKAAAEAEAQRQKLGSNLN